MLAVTEALSLALPNVKTISQCADYTTTVIPYASQLAELPTRLLQSYNDIEALKAIYLSTNPLISGFAFSLAIFPIFLIVSEINKNYSQVDRFWSILPALYNVHLCAYAHLTGLNTQRLDTLSAFSIIWGLRLTFNYWRKGGYSIGSEDYRWEILRTYISPSLFFILNIFFISLAQSVLLFSITTPTYLVLLASQVLPDEMSNGDIIFTRVLVGLVLLEFFADQQQWNFQQAKKSYQQTAKAPPKYDPEDLDRGFVVSGLWSWSRHPNFAAEQAIWIGLYQYSCFLTDTYYNWSLVGALAYVILFQASTWFTELVSAGKYDQYREYQMRVGKFLPKLSMAIKGDGKEAPPPPPRELSRAEKSVKKQGEKTK